MTPRWPRLLIQTGVALAALAAAVDAAGLAADRAAGHARQALGSGDASAALAQANFALRLDPWQIEAFYTHSVALKRLGQWNKLAGDTSRAMAAWDPDAVSLALLAGEAQMRIGRAQPAAEALWLAFWLSPQPEHSPAALWDMAMETGKGAWGPRDPRVAAAALQIWRQAATDPLVSATGRADLRERALSALRSAGAPEAAKLLAAETP